MNRYRPRPWFVAISLACGLIFTTTAHAAETSAFQTMVHDWYQDDFRVHPMSANYAGFHEWDGKMEDVTVAGHETERQRLHGWLVRLHRVDAKSLSMTDQDDREILIGKIKARLLEEEDIQSWRHDPGIYSGLVTEAVFQTIKRDYAPLADRLRFAIAREGRIPEMLATAKTLIDKPPRVYVDVALENIDGAIGFFEASVPEAFKPVADADLQKQLADVNAKALAALKDYRDWLKTIQPTADGNFALGAENYRRKLDYEEMVDMPVDQVLAVGEAQLKKDQAAFVATAHRIDPSKSPDQVAAELIKDHPTADTLVSTARDELVALRKFIVDRNLVPLPPEHAPTVLPTPTFERALIEAEEDSPGPYDKNAKEAFYFVTPPGPELTAEQREEYLQGYSIPVLNNVSVHEVFPGHFVQLMLMRSLPDLSMVRRLSQTNSNVEGWAHYCEQMTLDEGFGNDDPKLRLGQIVDALLRDARYIVGIKLHTAGMTVDQATDFFANEGHQSRPVARKEALRGTSDPTYLYYALGKLEILKLRQDWQAKMGDKYTIGEFHKRLMESGTVPIKIIRREMMGTDGPLL
jgi:uncharacterized protein (DUF885 family)